MAEDDGVSSKPVNENPLSARLHLTWRNLQKATYTPLARTAQNWGVW